MPRRVGLLVKDPATILRERLYEYAVTTGIGLGRMIRDAEVVQRYFNTLWKFTAHVYLVTVVLQLS